MFSIDLLNGRGKPLKGNLKSTLLKAVPLLIPVIAVMAWAASYQQDCARVETQTAAIHRNQVKIVDSVMAVKSYCQMNSKLTEMRKYLEMIDKGLSYRVQVSDLLVEFVKTLPDDIFIYEIQLDRKPTLKREQKEGSGNVEEKLVLKRNLKLVLCGFDIADSDQSVREYVNTLKSSEVLSGVFTDFKPSARQQGTVDERSAIYYEIECTLRDQG